MCKELLRIIRAFKSTSAGLTYGEKQILDKLDILEKKIDRQDKSMASQSWFGIGVGLMVAAAGLAAASLNPAEINTPGLILVLIFGGALLIFWSSAVYRERYPKRWALAGTFLILIGIALIGFFGFLPGVIIFMIGFLIILCTTLFSLVRRLTQKQRDITE
jgi:small-conductance mechanosensitive channel